MIWKHLLIIVILLTKSKYIPDSFGVLSNCAFKMETLSMGDSSKMRSLELLDTVFFICWRGSGHSKLAQNDWGIKRIVSSWQLYIFCKGKLREESVFLYWPTCSQH